MFSYGFGVKHRYFLTNFQLEKHQVHANESTIFNYDMFNDMNRTLYVKMVLEQTCALYLRRQYTCMKKKLSVFSFICIVTGISSF